MPGHRYARHPKNRTPYAKLDKLASDPRIEEIIEDGDGIWANLAPGYTHEGCISIHGALPEGNRWSKEARKFAVQDLLDQVSGIEKS